MTAAEFLDRYWTARAPREKALVACAAISILAAIAYLVLLGPGRAARERLAARLPVMRAQIDDMRQQQKEIVILRKKLGAASQRTDLRTLLESSAARTPFASAMERLVAGSGEKVTMRASPVAFDDWLAWVEGLQRDFGVRLDACQISALGQPGLVRIEAVFAVGPSSGPKTP